MAPSGNNLPRKLAQILWPGFSASIRSLPPLMSFQEDWAESAHHSQRAAPVTHCWTQQQHHREHCDNKSREYLLTRAQKHELQAGTLADTQGQCHRRVCVTLQATQAGIHVHTDNRFRCPRTRAAAAVHSLCASMNEPFVKQMHTKVPAPKGAWRQCA
eukprot:scaffold13117_cov19-Tisochrysis_lutea.AAC.2